MSWRLEIFAESMDENVDFGPADLVHRLLYLALRGWKYQSPAALSGMKRLHPRINAAFLGPTEDGISRPRKLFSNVTFMIMIEIILYGTTLL